MSAVALRPALPADEPALVALDVLTTSEPQRIGEIQYWLSQGWVSVAECDDTVVGYGVLHNHFYGRSFLELVMVASPHRRKGIGSVLVRHALQICQSTELWSSTNQSNHAMQGLLDRLGFVRSGIIENLDPDDPELIYRAVRPRD
tara:strand:- start:12299 stop:12733 length:435 start_codon:yes stop_codon:yes gene_type:complete